MPLSPASLNREQNRKQLSQPDADRINLRLPGRINGRRTHWEDAMTTRDEQCDPRRHDFTTNPCPRSGGSRRRHRGGCPRRVGPKPSSEPSSRPSGAAVHDHQPAARFQSARRADHLFLGPRHHRGRPVLQQPRPAQHGDQAPAYRVVVGRRPGLERAGPLSPVERHSQQPADAMVGGRRSRQRFPHAVQQLQRQLVRFPGPAALLRASHPPGGAL